MNNTLLYCREYGIRCTFSTMLYNLFRKSKRDSQLQRKLVRNKHRAILEYFYKHYYCKPGLKAYQTKSNDQDYSDCIWTAWLQGEENAPEVIQLTISSMRR